MKGMLLALAMVLPAFPAGGAVRAREGHPPYTVPQSETRIVTSGEGVAYRVHIRRPEAPPPAAGYPVLYVLDGEDNFAVAAETARRLERFSPRSGVTPGLVVAIARPQDGERRRALDFTPPVDMETDPMGNAIGGADRFLKFIEAELMPALAADYPVDPARQAIFGHSYGGLFVLHALFTRPEMFGTYIASSPSLWFADGAILKAEAAFAERLAADPMPLTLVLTVGEEERGGPSGRADMVAENRAMAHRLSALATNGLRLHHTVFNAANHGTASLPAIGLALPAAFAPPVQTGETSDP